jgi:RimJ/RimL family protein N-acetyltransferase
VVATSSSDRELGRPVDWSPRPAPDGRPLVGRWCRVVPLAEEHLPALYAEVCAPGTEADWAYLATGPYDDPEDFAAMCRASMSEPQRLSTVVLDTTGRPVGMASYLRIQPEHGSIEVGSILHGPSLQRTTAATEAMYLMMSHAFDDLGYRRYEWKCNSLNARSMRAAERLGFTYEGTHRNAMVVKGRSRDTAWFSITDDEWPLVRTALEIWMSDDNQGTEGQLQTLEAVRAELSGQR